MKRAIRFLTLSALAVFLLPVANAARPVDPDVADVFTYIASQQQPDGSIVATFPIATPYHSTARIAASLATSFDTSNEFNLARAYVDAAAIDTNEERARRLFLSDSPADLAALRAAQNADGGYGSIDGFGSNSLDSALALLAMEAGGVPIGLAGSGVVIGAGQSHVVTLDIPPNVTSCRVFIENLTSPIQFRFQQGQEPGAGGTFFTINSPNTFIDLTPAGNPPLISGVNYFKFTAPTGSTISYTVDYYTPTDNTESGTGGIKYLLQSQNSDGGWGLLATDDAESRIFYTHWAARALGSAANSASVAAYIAGKETGGGGFGDFAVANVFDTAVALATLTALGVDPNVQTPASIAWFEAQQLPNDSFADDPYITAWALDALLGYRAPLAPSIESNGGAGTGQDFVTNQTTVVITGFLPVGAAGIEVNDPSAIVTFDETTGQYTITVDLSEGLNAIQINAISAAGVVGASTTINVTVDSSLLTQGIALGPDLNLLGLSLDPANPLTAIGLLQQIGPDAQEVQKVSPVSGNFERVARDGMGGFTGNDFALAGLDGVNVIMRSAGSVNIVGSEVALQTVDLLAGVNAIALPNPPSNLTAFALLQLIGDMSMVSAVQGFNTDTGLFETAVYSGLDPAGVDFPIEKDLAYYVFMRQALSGFNLPVGIPATIAITSPTNGATVTASPVTVSGTVTGVAPLTVTVNGVAAVVVGGTFSADVPLSLGSVPITASVSDDAGGADSDSITITYTPVDFVIPLNSSVSGTRTFFIDPSLIPFVMFFTDSVFGLPAGVNYLTTGVNIAPNGDVEVSFNIDTFGGPNPNIYTFQLEYGLVDGNFIPLPVSGNIFNISIDVTP